MSTCFELDKFTMVKDVNRTDDSNQLIHDWLFSCFCTLLISAPPFWFLILVVLCHSVNSIMVISNNFSWTLLPLRNVNFAQCNKC